MKIKEIIRQHRRDFKAIYECEGCGDTAEGAGYDDNYFHTEVIPEMICNKCGESSKSLAVDYRPLQPKYAEGFQI